MGAVVLQETVARKKPSADSKAEGRLKIGTALIPALIGIYTAAECTFEVKGAFIRAAIASGGSLDRGFWVETVAVKTFEYSQAVPQSNNLLWQGYDVTELQKQAALIIDEIASRDFKPPEITSTFTFPAPVDRVWSAVVEALANIQVPFELVDKNSGLITTRPAPDPQADTMVCATAYDEDHYVVFNLFLKEKDGVSSLRINASFTAVRDRTPIKCFSNGILESWLSSKVTAILNEK